MPLPGCHRQLGRGLRCWGSRLLARAWVSNSAGLAAQLPRPPGGGLVASDASALAASLLQEGTDFVVIAQGSWQALHKWYSGEHHGAQPVGSQQRRGAPLPLSSRAGQRCIGPRGSALPAHPCSAATVNLLSSPC